MCIPQESPDGYVHCEYDGGYIVFNRIGNYTEVWRRRIDVLDIPVEAWPSGSHNKPDEEMVEGNRIAENRYLDPDRSRDPNHLRGQFVPWARLAIPERNRAFRLTRGRLLESSSQLAFLYNVERAELEQTIELDAYGLGDIRHVDMSEQHLFFVRVLQLNVYDRATSSLLLTIPAGRQPFDFYASPEDQLIRTEGSFNYGELGFRTADSALADMDEYFHAGA